MLFKHNGSELNDEVKIKVGSFGKGLHGEIAENVWHYQHLIIRVSAEDKTNVPCFKWDKPSFFVIVEEWRRIYYIQRIYYDPIS